jgi:hypothetical protein
MKKYYYILDDYNRFYLITDIKRDDIPELQEIESDLNLNEIHTHYHGVINNQIVVIGENEEDIKIKNKNNNISIINKLKENLSLSDYKVIKCYEAQLLNETMPYDLQELLNERKLWRDEINRLEFELSMLGN